MPTADVAATTWRCSVTPHVTPAENESAQTVSDLRELVAALDRRTAYDERPEEAAIAHAAAVLRSEALKRIDELEAHTTAG